jgi:carnosine N-methyltransferase
MHVGPLLWHFENNTTNDPSIELDLEEVKALARQMGFEISVSLKFQIQYSGISAYGAARGLE